MLAVFASNYLSNMIIYQSDVSDAIGSMASKWLPALHTYTDCDTVSAFGNKNESYQEI